MISVDSQLCSNLYARKNLICWVGDFKNTIKAGGSTAICKMLTGVGDGVDGVDTP